ncbi:AAA family ATPase [Chitinophaga polysaccharea]|uniref:AAA family ATPase n=1 Tax=Chitinophaga TaxID=79328 RepID=UPI001455D23A|nr:MULTISPECIES: ATP-binding protein [Chitinophaga]NLR58257.1 AAA family ATPase [Chitinophaga polysaccharea]NLU90783.1 AAA family ATPase [Chitinophaga sp. Ak27]
MNIYDLIIHDQPTIQLENIFLPGQNRQAIQQLIKEHRFIHALHQYGLPVNNKLLLFGSSGCGKTTTAKGIAGAMNKPLMILNLSNVVCPRIGETAQNIKSVFDKAAREGAVLFLDEFDQIGKARSDDDKDVGEMRRLVNTLIQLIDYYPEKSLLICATNHIEMIDAAILRRFQLRIRFEMPGTKELDNYYEQLLAPFPPHLQQINRAYNISFAEAKDTAFTQVKSRLIAELELQATMAEV